MPVVLFEGKTTPKSIRVEVSGGPCHQTMTIFVDGLEHDSLHQHWENKESGEIVCHWHYGGARIDIGDAKADSKEGYQKAFEWWISRSGQAAEGVYQ